jgi:hypothetical protein
MYLRSAAADMPEFQFSSVFAKFAKTRAIAAVYTRPSLILSSPSISPPRLFFLLPMLVPHAQTRGPERKNCCQETNAERQTIAPAKCNKSNRMPLPSQITQGVLLVRAELVE